MPYTTWPTPTSATRCRSPSSEKTIVSTSSSRLKYSRGCFLLAQLALPHVARHVGPPEIGRQVAAGVRAADLQAGELVERPVEDQPREEVGRLERVADDVAEIAASAQRALLEDVVGAARVHEHQHAELGGLGPERIELRQRQHPRR